MPQRVFNSGSCRSRRGTTSLKSSARAFDPFHAPEPTTTIARVRVRDRVVVRGRVTDSAEVRWRGGPVFEATVSDGTDALLCAFLGRRKVAAFDPGRMVTIAGTVGLRRSRRQVMNPRYWLQASTLDVSGG